LALLHPTTITPLLGGISISAVVMIAAAVDGGLMRDAKSNRQLRADLPWKLHCRKQQLVANIDGMNLSGVLLSETGSELGLAADTGRVDSCRVDYGDHCETSMFLYRWLVMKESRLHRMGPRLHLSFVTWKQP
jgi:hypothetical protein